jgi:hypothetical protein
MAADYEFSVQPVNARLMLTRGLVGSPGTWRDLSASDKLVVKSGTVDESQTGRLICIGSNGKPVVSLLGAGWDTPVGKDGPATCDLCTDTPKDQTWVLTGAYGP